jgi:phosphoribosyl-ATP pyrophosphohydrolase/phosphoribosyl-AMP cyclohydrolase
VKASQLNFDSQGLVPAIVQSVTDSRVLMVAYMSKESLRLTFETGQTHFFSRSRSELWHKGKESGNTQEVVSIHADCDGDSLLIIVKEAGVACNTGERSCFDNFQKLELE